MGNLQFVFNLFELVLGFGFVKRGLNMRADFGRHSDGQRARLEVQTRSTSQPSGVTVKPLGPGLKCQPAM